MNNKIKISLEKAVESFKKNLNDKLEFYKNVQPICKDDFLLQYDKVSTIEEIISSFNVIMSFVKKEETETEHEYHKGFEDGVESVTLPRTFVAEKPILKSMDGFDTEVASQLVCPNCRNPIVNVWNTDKYKPNYCHYCGQKFDWGEEDKDNSEQKSILSNEEIIRCRDCKFCEHWYADKGLCSLWAEDGIDVFESGFCSYGKKKDNNVGNS